MNYSLSNNERCGNCRFWRDDQIEDESAGSCRRYPPIRMSMDLYKSFIGNDWGDRDSPEGFESPQTENSDWCGEHQRRPE